MRSDCGECDADLPGCRYFSARTDESHLSGWVSENEFLWLCERFGFTPPEKREPPAVPDLLTASKALLCAVGDDATAAAAMQLRDAIAAVEGQS